MNRRGAGPFLGITVATIFSVACWLLLFAYCSTGQAHGANFLLTGSKLADEVTKIQTTEIREPQFDQPTIQPPPPVAKSKPHWLIPTEPEHFFFIGASIADVVTTYQGLQRPGVYETNFILGKDPNLGALIGIKLVTYGGMKFLEHWTKPSRGWQIVQWCTPAVIYTIVSISNHGVGR